jgi:hypothetical protein
MYVYGVSGYDSFHTDLRAIEGARHQQLTAYGEHDLGKQQQLHDEQWARMRRDGGRKLHVQLCVQASPDHDLEQLLDGYFAVTLCASRRRATAAG